MENSSFQGQPSQRPNELSTSLQHTAVCSASNAPSNSQYISCHKCQNSYQHDRAVKANNREPFICDNCTKSALNSPIPTHRSNASNSSTRSIARRKNLELQRLEEERQLAIERDNEYLKQKYQLLQQAEEEEEVDDNDSFTVNSVHEWINSQPDPISNNTKNLPSEPNVPANVLQPPSDNNNTPETFRNIMI